MIQILSLENMVSWQENEKEKKKKGLFWLESEVEE